MGPFLPDAVRDQAVRRPDAPAVSEGDRTVGFRALDRRSNRLGQALLAEGIEPGARVACLVRPGILSAEFLLGCAKAGLVATPLNWRLAEPELAAVARDAGFAAVITQEEFLSGALAVRAALPGARLIVDVADTAEADGTAGPDGLAYEPWLAAASDADPGRGGAGEGGTVCLQLYTSGTTGQPKGVQLTLRNLDAGDHLMREVGWDEQAVSMNAMPFFHIAGTAWLAHALVAGAHTVTVPDLVPQHVVELMERERISHVFFVPAVLHMLTSLPDIEKRDFSALRLIAYGASPPITPALLRRSMDCFGCGFLQIYGQTETAGTATRLLPEDHDPDGPRAHLLRSAGNPRADVEIRVADPLTGEPLPTGAVGEICTRSHYVTPGYWHREDDNARLFGEDGWLRTGDAGRLDAEGYLYITDRIKDMVITGGENVYPVEVEAALAEHPSVLDVAVFGTPDERWGEAVTAAVVLRPDAGRVEPEELIAFTRERIASYKKPQQVHFLDELPRNPTGKILKRVLREQFGEPS
ncbi:acyl-CoA synthetase (AMP-forming)/AMP-acid ligase II [Streptacidiphilus sp. MAP12-33]|uniref:long-chain-fatty-acid--CoA ligase n=1 Tax=Streptacidiphilus sp. MAP12-33 TaxID=3156266 RepID=UPI003517F2C6